MRIRMENEKIKLKVPSKYGEIELEGTPEAIKEVVNDIFPNNRRKLKQSIRDLIIDLIDDGFFDEPKRLGEIKTELERRGFTFPETSIFPVLQRDFLKKKIIDRNGSKRSYGYFVKTK